MQECNDGRVQVVALLSAGRRGDIEQLPIRHDLALRRVQAEGCRNLDSLAGCGIIGTHVLCTIEAVQFELGGLTFLGAGPLTPASPRCMAGIENGRRPG